MKNKLKGLINYLIIIGPFCILENLSFIQKKTLLIMMLNIFIN